MTRNLTHQSDPFGSETQANPFDDQSSSASPDTTMGGSRTNLLSEAQGYEERVLPLGDSMDRLNPPLLGMGNHQSINKDMILNAPGLDRYPGLNRLSHAPSYASFNSSPFRPASTDNYIGAGLNSNLSEHAPDDVDFSPFGGFPASSFPLLIDEKEDDDYIHNPDPVADAEYEKNRFMYDMKNIDRRSAIGFAGLVVLGVGMLLVFVLLPVITYSGVLAPPKPSLYIELSAYRYPTLSAIRTNLVDKDTPAEFLTRKARDGSEWNLVFSDEFNVEGRTFYEGDDQFWYAPDFNYAATQDLEWYDPDAVTTANGTARFRMDAFENHNLYYRSGMLHSWNKMCFTQGVMEVSIRLPKQANLTGLWPGAWSMGNLGRPGYMATTEGVWPYTYEACDSGITPNQSSTDGISYLPGQKLNSCTCKGEAHPNRGTGRGAPEIDIIEAAIDTTLGTGVASQSLQIAPFDIWYMPDYDFVLIKNSSVTTMNTYAGGPFQQAVSGTTTLNPSWYDEGGDGRYFQNYAYEYLNDNTDGYVTWYVGEEETFTIHALSLAPNGNVDWRRISKEPMSMILNLGISNSWAYINWPGLEFPATMEIDYVRIYQPPGSENLSCDPDDYPTAEYIAQHLNAYQNVNHTSWEMAGYKFPKNSLTGC